jgi:hypothetical protein
MLCQSEGKEFDMRVVLSMLLCCSLQFAGGANAAGQQSPVAPLAEGASLAERLQWLDSQLVRYGRMRYYDPYGPFERKYYDARFEYLRSEGCVVRYRDSAMRHGEEYSADLTELDPTQVKAEVPKGWTGGRVVFVSVAGKEAVSRQGRGEKVQRYRTGGFGVSKQEALGSIAEELRRAILSCRK